MFGFRDIEVIRAIVRHGGFRAASEATGLAQSAISRRIRHLEDRLKVTIFERDGRGVRLSAIGRKLFEETDILIAQRDRIIGELTHDVIAGVVRLGVTETLTHTLLPRMLTTLRARHPQLRFEISIDTSAQLGKALTRDELDVVMLLRDLAPPGTHLTPLSALGHGWYVNPRHFQPPEPASIHDLAALPIVSFSKGTIPHRRVVDLLAPAHRQAAVVHGSASLATIMHLIVQGFGVGTVPHDIAEAWPGLGLREVAVEPDARLPDLDFAICYSTERNEKIGREVTRCALECDNGPIPQGDQ